MFVALAAVLLAGVQLSGCSAPTRAKVVSLEQPSKRAPAGTGSSSTSSSYHRVRKGDTLYTIAWLYGLDLPELAAWNGIHRPYTIYPGQSLRLFPPVKRAVRSSPAETHTAPATRPSVTSKTLPAAPAPRQSAKNQTASAKQAATDGGFDDHKRLVWQWPTNGKLEQQFSSVDPSRKGIKISGSNGQRVVAAESGKVVYAGSGLIGYGQLIIIKHNKNYLSAYGHNRKLLVDEGTVVRKGEPVAEMGRNGGGGPTLHFEIRRNGTPVNPMKLLPRRR